jgi:type IV pilus assembly protein PilM
MQILPSSIRFIGAGLRPRLACEVRPQSIVAARADNDAGLIAQAASAPLPAGAFVPSLRSGNIVDRAAFIAALQNALDPLAGRSRDITLIVPDTAVRVLLLDFDALPSRASEALSVVRFRLKKLLPFEADEAGVSYQIMSSEREMVRVVAAAMPKEVLDEYEFAIRDAGYFPGAILPSTLASFTLLPSRAAGEKAALIVNANPYAVTTAIVRNGIILLHRALDFNTEIPTLPEVRAEENAPALPAPPAPVFATDLNPEPPVVTPYVEPLPTWELADTPAHGSSADDAPAVVSDVFPENTDDSSIAASAAMQSEYLRHELASRRSEPAPPSPASETLTSDVAQAVSIAAAYFEDTLQAPPTQIFSSGMLDARSLETILAEAGFGDANISVRELVASALLLADAATSSIPRSLLSGVAGALATGDTVS